MKLSVISPTYNESKNVGRLIDELEKALRGVDYEILISDDDSPDLTWVQVEEIARRNPRVRVLRRVNNRGLGASVIDGFSCATGEVVACIDADLQHDPAILPRMLKELTNGFELVVGSRYAEGGSTGDWGFIRRLESMVATKMAHWLLGLKMRDPMAGYFMLRRDDFTRVRDRLDGRGFKILLEIAANLRPSRVCEVPYTFRSRTAGQSKLSGKIIYSYLVQLLRLSFLDKRLPADFVKFAIVGGTGVVVNLSTMAAILYLTNYRDWRASALSTLVATLNNYTLNNLWTFRDRAHRGRAFVKRYSYYILASLCGFAVTTASYTTITWILGKMVDLNGTTFKLHSAVLLLCQCFAILAGTFCNFFINTTITWPHLQKQAGRRAPWSFESQ